MSNINGRLDPLVVKGGIRVFFIMWRTISLSLLSVVCMFGATGALAVVQSYSFTINDPTDVYVFRGGDGNAGTVNVDGNVISGGGGGASGVPSMVAFGDNVVISDGGSGGRGGRGVVNNSEVYECGSGGGGGGAVQAKFTLAQNLDGGAGGSGSTGTSASSFVRIYKFG